jgi:hypothetical protein
VALIKGGLSDQPEATQEALDLGASTNRRLRHAQLAVLRQYLVATAGTTHNVFVWIGTADCRQCKTLTRLVANDTNDTPNVCHACKKQPVTWVWWRAPIR